MAEEIEQLRIAIDFYTGLVQSIAAHATTDVHSPQFRIFQVHGEQLPIYLEGINDTEMKLRNLHRAAKTDPSIDIKSCGQLRDQILDLNIQLRTPMSVKSEPTPPQPISIDQPPSPPFTPSSPTVAATTVSACQSAIRLPKIPLPTFDGHFANWPCFKLQFSQMIDKSSNIALIDKFHYLLAALKGPALDVVAPFMLSPNNYPTAFKALCDKYDSPRRLATYHWEQMANAKSADRSSLRQLLDTYNKHLAMLNAMDLPICALSEVIIFNTLFSKLDLPTREAFERTQPDSNALPSLQALHHFLEKECDSLELAAATGIRSFNIPQRRRPVALNTTAATPSHWRRTPSSCCWCNQPHRLSECSTFKEKSPAERRHIVEAANRCVNCLGRHALAQCPSRFRCRSCGALHHTFLHAPTGLDQHNPSSINQNISSTVNQHYAANQPGPSSSTVNLHSSTDHTEVLLATAVLAVADRHCKYHGARSVLDSGSQASFITSRLAQRLRLPVLPADVSVSGIGGTYATMAKGTTLLTFKSRFSNEEWQHKCIILPNITKLLPAVDVPSHMLNQLPKPSADDEWFKSSPIDILFGADIIPALTIPNSHNTTIGGLIATETVFGWTLMGRLPSVTSLISTMQLGNSIKQFSNLKEMPTPSDKATDEATAEDAFQRSITQLSKGQFMLTFPFRHGTPSLGDSSDKSNRRMWLIEKQLLRDPILPSQYVAFIKAYLQQQHMRLISSTELIPTDAYYKAHPGIIRSGELQQIRVDFVASNSTMHNRPLNDKPFIGPKWQLDIMNLLLRFRIRSISLSYNNQQMYRQILIVPEHQHYQLIQWRFGSQQPISTYALQTDSYEPTSSPCHALRTLKQLDDQHEFQFSPGASAFTQRTYVSDILYTADDVQPSLRVRDEPVPIARLELQKWSSNHSAVLSGLLAMHCATISMTFRSPDDHAIRILGLRRRPPSDAFYFDVHTRPPICTTINISPEVARIFDPIEFRTPFTLQPKKLFLRLWTAGIGRDDEPPDYVVRLRSRFQSKLPQLNSLPITRYKGLASELSIHNYLHGICVSSAVGYAAVIYLRIHNDHRTKLHLLAARSKVAPLKLASHPRLELQAALLLSGLLPYDDAQFFRVGGHLRHAKFPEEANHPLSFPGEHTSTKFIIRHIRFKYFHVGPTTCHLLLLQRYRVLSARRAVRSVIFIIYVICYRLIQRPYAPLNGRYAFSPRRRRQAILLLRRGLRRALPDPPEAHARCRTTISECCHHLVKKNPLRSPTVFLVGGMVQPPLWLFCHFVYATAA